MNETSSVPDTIRGRPAAAAGVIGSTLALIGATRFWPGEPLVVLGSFGSPIAIVLALLALGAFLGRRWNILDGTVGPLVAGVSGFALAMVASYRLVSSSLHVDAVPEVGAGLWLTMFGGVLSVGFALSDYRGAEADDLRDMVMGVALAIGLTIAGFIVQILLTIPLGAFMVDEFTAVLVRILSPITLVGFVVVAVAFLLATDRGVEWIDLSLPSMRDLGYMVAGIVGLVAVQIVVAVIIISFDIPSSENVLFEIAETAVEEGYVWLILVLIPIQLLVVGPAEELLFRGVIQKYLYGAFTRWGAIVVTSMVFAAAHVFAYWDANPAALFVSLSAVFMLSLVLGAIYERTDNLVVPAVAHGVFNSILVALLYISVVYEPPPDAAMLLLP